MDEIGGACKARWFAEAAGVAVVGGLDAPIERVATDSRDSGPGALFVALAGERVDGHSYARAAADAGASSVLVSSAWWSGPGRAAMDGSSAVAIVAPDPLAALQRAAESWRALFPSLARFGVTGSSGKTTAKELLAAILGASRKVVKNPGNLNSEIGLPASVFLLRRWHEAAVFEMGVNRPGEMDLLSRIWRPDCAVITNIGSAHIGVLGGSREGIAAEKKKIASRFDGSQSLVYWEDDDFKDQLASEINGKAYAYGPRSTEGFEGARDLGVDGWLVRYRGVEARLRLPGAHNLLDALAAIRAAELYGAEASDVAEGLEAVSPLPGRTMVHKGDISVVDDCYNANAESVAASIGFCDSVDARGRRLYVIGSMKELGDESRSAHARMGRSVAASKADEALFFGEEARDAYDSAMEATLAAGFGPRLGHFVEYEALERAVVASAKPGDLVLVKASRTMALERLVERLTGRGGHHVP